MRAERKNPRVEKFGNFPLRVGSPSPKGGSEKGDPTKQSLESHFEVTVESLKSVGCFSGSPCSDPPLGDGDRNAAPLKEEESALVEPPNFLIRASRLGSTGDVLLKIPEMSIETLDESPPL